MLNVFKLNSYSHRKGAKYSLKYGLVLKRKDFFAIKLSITIPIENL